MKAIENTFSVKRAEDSSGFLLWQVTTLWAREIALALKTFGLTHSQFVLLASAHWLTLQKKEVTQIILSAHSKIDPMTTSTVLRTLVAKGLIMRAKHTTDTRAKIISLTGAGRKKIMPAVVAVETFDREFFARLRTNQSKFNKQLLALAQK